MGGKGGGGGKRGLSAWPFEEVNDPFKMRRDRIDLKIMRGGAERRKRRGRRGSIQYVMRGEE